MDGETALVVALIVLAAIVVALLAARAARRAPEPPRRVRPLPQARGAPCWRPDRHGPRINRYGELED